MATAQITLSNIEQGAFEDGLRVVEATLDFDTGDYVTGGLILSTVVNATGETVMEQLGLKEVRKAFVVAYADAQAPYTQAQWVTANDTVSLAFFVDVTTSPIAPKLLIYSAGNQHGASAIDATAQVRIRFLGS